jgi:hypothetical protein
MTRRSEMSTYLLGRGAREDIFTSAFLGDLALVRQLLAERPSLAQVSDPATDVLTITPIHHAVGGDQLPTLRVLLGSDKLRNRSAEMRFATFWTAPAATDAPDAKVLDQRMCMVCAWPGSISPCPTISTAKQDRLA